MSDLVVVLWTLIAFAGLIVSVLNALDAFYVWRDHNWTEPLAAKLAFYQFRRSTIRTLALGLFALVGIIVLVPEVPVSAGVMVRWLLVTAGALIALSEFLERFEVMWFKKNGSK